MARKRQKGRTSQTLQQTALCGVERHQKGTRFKNESADRGEIGQEDTPRRWLAAPVVVGSLDAVSQSFGFVAELTAVDGGG